MSYKQPELPAKQTSLLYQRDGSAPPPAHHFPVTRPSPTLQILEAARLKPPPGHPVLSPLLWGGARTPLTPSLDRSLCHWEGRGPALPKSFSETFLTTTSHGGEIRGMWRRCSAPNLSFMPTERKGEGCGDMSQHPKYEFRARTDTLCYITHILCYIIHPRSHAHAGCPASAARPPPRPPSSTALPPRPPVPH